MDEPTNPAGGEVEDLWRGFLTRGREAGAFRFRHLMSLVPADPRCRLCHAPFRGVGGALGRMLFDRRPSTLNPRMCSVCENFARQHQGGAEVELSLLFADVRGSTTLAERMSPAEFSQLVNRFYNAASDVLIRTDALIDKIIGDQAAGIYVPGFAGPQHAQRAVEAAKSILRATGHEDRAGPWIPVGAGVHTGVAFVGSVGSKGGTNDITVLGDTANTAARLSSSARPGEILVSEAACEAADLPRENLESRVLELKGKSIPVRVYVLQVGPSPAAARP